MLTNAYVKRICAGLALSCAGSGVMAICPERPVNLCDMVARHDWVVSGVVGSRQLIKDEDDPEGVAGWLYHLESVTTYKGIHRDRVAVFSENSTSRVVLDSGDRYFVFLFTDDEGVLRTANYCDDFSEARFSPVLEQQVLKCFERKK